ncbi:aminotransferase class I/II-fold pyridoxal phosphate-dependent enzyme, partial [Chryseobacterium sp. EO14]
MEKLAIHGGKSAIDLKMPHYIWPIIDKSDIVAVTNQLQETVSIYDNSGVFKEFEKKWKDLHGADFALLTNSGTSALFSLFVGVGLKESDEIICPNYTFFATITTALTLGAVPVFCDCDENGNINPEYIEGLITRKTKAVVITHIWGVPCQMDKIVAICKQYHLHLIEDCSHAHGAKYKGQLVGTFGIGAAWSLQGQKIITGGEGGILTTSSEEVYYRALLLGHYNKRCRQEIPQDHPLYA